MLFLGGSGVRANRELRHGSIVIQEAATATEGRLASNQKAEPWAALAPSTRRRREGALRCLSKWLAAHGWK